MPLLRGDTVVCGLWRMHRLADLRSGRDGDPVWYWDNSNHVFRLRPLNCARAKPDNRWLEDSSMVRRARVTAPLGGGSNVGENTYLIGPSRVMVCPNTEKDDEAYAAKSLPTATNLPLLTFRRQAYNAARWRVNAGIHWRTHPTPRWRKYPKRLADMMEARVRLVDPQGAEDHDGDFVDCRPVISRLDEVKPTSRHQSDLVREQLDHQSPLTVKNGRVYLEDVPIVHVKHGIVLFRGPVLAGDR